jgi:hypothetical protein
MALSRPSIQLPLKLWLVIFSILGTLIGYELLSNNSVIAQDNRWGRGLNLQKYCEDTRGEGSHNTVDYQITVRAVPNEINGWFTPRAYRWACVSNVRDIHTGRTSYGLKRSIDTQRACRMQYGNEYKARVGDENNPYSWYCTRD